MSLNGQQYEILTAAILEAFPDEDTLDTMVRFKLGKPLNHITRHGTLEAIAYRVIIWADAHDKVEDLIIGAINRNPDNRRLRAVAEQWKIDSGAGAFERIVLRSVPLMDVETWRAKMVTSERPVCRLELRGNIGVGTAFLISASLAITTRHVIDELLLAGYHFEDVVLRFDYKQKADGTTVQEGKAYRLATSDPLVDDSPVEELDYAVLQLKSDAGQEPVAGQPEAQRRGWLTPHPCRFNVGDPLFIIQHPKATPMKFAPGSVDSVEAVTNRVYYTANTQQGSSGSPCFTSDWRVVALHHWGNTNHNRGVIFSAILPRLRIKKLLPSAVENDEKG